MGYKPIFELQARNKNSWWEKCRRFTVQVEGRYCSIDVKTGIHCNLEEVKKNGISSKGGFSCEYIETTFMKV